MNRIDKMKDTEGLTAEKIKLVWMYNALQERIDAYWLDEIAIDSWPFKKLCANKQQIEMRINEINSILDSNK